MIDFRLTAVADPTAAQLTEFKAFIAANGAESDALLLAMLRRAMLAVQEWEDRSLLAGTAVLTAADRDDPAEPVLLYGTPATITSVVDGDGNAVAYSLVGRLLVPSYRAAVLTITYTTAPTEPDLAELLPKVYRYGAALVDGDGSADLARILQER